MTVNVSASASSAHAGPEHTGARSPWSAAWARSDSWGAEGGCHAPAARSGERQRGWGLAHWAVANASALHIKRVSYAGLVWTAGNTRSEWRADASSSRNSTGEVRIVTAQ